MGYDDYDDDAPHDIPAWLEDELRTHGYVKRRQDRSPARKKPDQDPAPSYHAGESAVFLPKSFFARFRETLQTYDECRADLDGALADVPVRTARPLAANENNDLADSFEDLSGMHDEIMINGRDCLVFLCWCHKNNAFMPDITRQEKNWALGTLHMHLALFESPEWVASEMKLIVDGIFDASAGILKVLPAELRRERLQDAIDPFVHDILGAKREITRKDVESWMEYSFLEAYSFPLGMFGTDQRTHDHIIERIVNPRFQARTLCGIHSRALQEVFPGMTVVEPPQNDLAFRRAQAQISNHAFGLAPKTPRLIF